MSTYTFAITFSGGNWIEVTKTAYTKIEARHAAWHGLTETQRDHVESIECIEQVAA